MITYGLMSWRITVILLRAKRHGLEINESLKERGGNNYLRTIPQKDEASPCSYFQFPPNFNINLSRYSSTQLVVIEVALEAPLLGCSTPSPPGLMARKCVWEREKEKTMSDVGKPPNQISASKAITQHNCVT